MQQKIRRLLQLEFRGRGTIDYQVFGIGGLLALSGSLLVAADFSDSYQVFGLALANLIAIAALLPLLLGFDKFFIGGRESAKLTLAQLILFGMLLGFLKGALTGLAMFGLGFEIDLQLSVLSRVWQTTILGAWFVPMLALFGTLRSRYVEQREALVSEKVARQVGLPAQAGPLLEFVEGVRSRLSELRSDTDRKKLAAELQSIITEDLRPLSYRLWAKQSAEFPGFGILQIARLSISQKLFQPMLVTTVWTLTTLVPTLIYFGATPGLEILVWQAVALALTLFVASRIATRSFPASLAVFIAAVVAVWVIQTVIAASLATGYLVLNEPSLLLVHLLWIFELTLLSAMARAFLDLGKRVEAEMKQFDPAGANSRFGQDVILKNRQLAQYLHGHLQSQLNAAAVRIANQEDAESIGADLDQLEKLLSEALTSYGSQQAQSIEEGIQRLKSDWGGLVEFTFLIEPTVIEDREIQVICEVINEATANAVRHGFASRMSIIITHQLDIEIVDNGTGPRDGKPGLGSRYFDSVAQKWEITPTTSGSKLLVSLRAKS
jgi:signal transduction histidine kinase